MAMAWVLWVPAFAATLTVFVTWSNQAWREALDILMTQLHVPVEGWVLVLVHDCKPHEIADDRRKYRISSLIQDAMTSNKN